MRIIALIFVLIFATPATANSEWVAECEAALEAEGEDPSGCACLVEEIGDDKALLDEFLALSEIEDPDARYDAASDAAKAVLDACAG